MTEDLLVVGGGPAGAACALWAHQLGLRVLLLEAGPSVGGLQLRSPYANRWLPGQLGQTGQDVAAGVPHVLGFKVDSIRRSRDPDWELSGQGASGRHGTHRARCVVIASGSTPRRGDFVESEHVGIGPGISMERLAVRDQRVAILGGGDNAFDQAVFALRRGARSVDIFCRRPPHAQAILRRAVPADCVHVGPFVADQARSELPRGRGEGGSPRGPQVEAGPVSVNGRPYDVLGVQFGFEARIPGELRLPLRDGYVDVDRCGAVAGFPGLFAAGEVTNYWHPCVTTAYAHGVQVAKSIQARLTVPAGTASILALPSEAALAQMA